MPVVTSITLDQVFTVMKAFIMATLGLDNAHVIKGYGNRVAYPVGPFVLMTAVLNTPLRTVVDDYDPLSLDPSTMTHELGLQLAIQLDVYGPASSEWAVALSTLLRNDVGVQALAPVCSPLYCDALMHAPLDDGEEEYSDRWIVTAQLQYNPVTTVAQDFMNVVGPAELHDVDVDFPPV